MKVNCQLLRQASYIVGIIFLISISACNSQKRTTKALMKMNSKEMNSVRPWPYNYTYQEYVGQMNEAKLKQEFYTKRQIQATIAGDRKTAQTMENNIQQNKDKIKRLKKDKKFYKIYKMQSREIKTRIKTEKKTQRKILEQSKSRDRASEREKSESQKKRDKIQDARKERTDEKLKKLEDKQEDLEGKNREIKQAISKKEKEKNSLQKSIDKANEDDVTYYEEELDIVQEELNALMIQQEASSTSLDSMLNVKNKFIELYYGNDSIPASDFPLYSVPSSKK